MRQEVWNNAIKCFKEMRLPFDVGELTKLDVTFDECGELSSKIAISMEFVDWLQHTHPEIFVSLITSQITPGMTTDDVIKMINHCKQVKDLQEVRKKIEHLKV